MSESENLKSKVKIKRKNKSDLGENYVAPDGGWGWVVCVASGVSNMVVLPGLQLFGLIYRKNLAALNISSTQISTLINTEYALAAFTGLFNGPLYSKFTFREVGLAGSVLVFIGLLSSAWCTNFIEYVITYSILFGIGMGLTQTSGSLALNTYFKEKRRKATGFSFTIAGIGPIVLPHLAVCVLAYFGYIGTVLTFAGITLISFISAVCYRPALQFSKGVHAPRENLEKGNENTEVLLEQETIKKRPSHLRKFINDLDLGLLKDKSFLNLLIGLTVIVFGEVNFFVLVPFILGESGFTDQQISLVMSILAGVDITVRFLGPFAMQKLPLGNKSIFAIGITFVSVGRLIVVLTNNFYVIIFAFVLLGFGKAIRTVIRTLIIADFVPLKRLPAASGLQLVATAIFSFAAGPLIGLAKQYWGFAVTIHILNAMSMTSLLSWGIEDMIKRMSFKKSKLPAEENIELETCKSL
ncbi:hypothetical protein ACFFRR_003337 [Megaselia abdita]